MNREHRYTAYMGLLIGLLLGLLLTLPGCSTVALERTEGSVSLQYRTFLTKIQAPQVQVQKEGDYSASFNAESKSSDLEIMRDMMSLVAGRIPQED